MGSSKVACQPKRAGVSQSSYAKAPEDRLRSLSLA